MFSRIRYRNCFLHQGSSLFQGGRCCSSLISKAREKLSHLGEGQVSLVKDDVSGIATITLEHAQKKNALSGQMMVQLADITEELFSWSLGKAVILQAQGDTFCSGGDLTTVKAISNPNDGLLMSTLMHNTLTQLYCLPLVTLCLVHGKALGGGAELTTVTDYRLFTNLGEVSFVQGRMGVVTGWGGGTRLVKLLGYSVALELLTTCRKLDGKEASKIGFADHIIEAANRHEETKNWLIPRILHEQEVIQAMKKIVVGGRDLTLEESLLNERLNFSPLWGGPANMRALGKNIKHK
ncbi:ethylmalonyl-CoA decarboxylase-like isoform X2 [Homarus americanus]|uniref:Ethylmalonyl-CoA decarboxylase-like n=2 Tax=Homarus americanus TaxID=6706 RepID=A0A8J5JZ48_HOMAM|nr:ethylmalonyl-CoA decarboxylase-like isoform X2 [Homarus americanus]XP_042231402.1 ethylmalonyl-CoA decarboxylase-like isoform X2 [Homarus americanus]XP_042231403.1 ethylmalonyl-CoA decarboxylase-like isoform X2 [Homarus americanus]XP_042231404.1 ethylmalonyl-CoA decarboxylase-like isoform X2 [Homarus americanus]KAG7163573.1 Ethylmalonyl-CoA decarboxylase-like [Homarus americanus]